MVSIELKTKVAKAVGKIFDEMIDNGRLEGEFYAEVEELREEIESAGGKRLEDIIDNLESTPDEDCVISAGFQDVLNGLVETTGMTWGDYSVYRKA